MAPTTLTQAARTRAEADAAGERYDQARQRQDAALAAVIAAKRAASNGDGTGSHRVRRPAV
jgi:hypothetical protein